MMVVIPAGGGGGYQIQRSLRFRSSLGAALVRVPSGITNDLKWTWSGWIKRGALGGTGILLSAGLDSSNYTAIYFSGDNLYVAHVVATVTIGQVFTTALYRDPSSWYHIVVAFDSANATALNRILVYANGVAAALTVLTQIPINTIGYVNKNVNHYIGVLNGFVNYFDGLMDEIDFVDGLALTPSSFGSANPSTGVWGPQPYSGSWGTNGYYLNFSDNSGTNFNTNTGLGKDYSGNGNYFSSTSFSLLAGVTYDSFTDVPTLTGPNAANYATLNPLNPSRSTLSNCNLTASGTTDTPTVVPDSGNWYFEIGGVAKNWTPPAAFPAAAGDYNFGQRPLTNAITAGYLLLNTFNLPAPAIPAGNKYMDATLFNGNGAAGNAVVNAAGFAPDLVWGKSRSLVKSHILVDTSRGSSAYVESDNTFGTEQSNANVISSLNSNGFTMGNDAQLNTNASTGVAWQFKKGATPGFDIVLYTGNGANRTIAHGLGVAPKMIFINDRVNAFGWGVYHASQNASPQNGYLILSSTAAYAASATIWNNTAPTSSVFSLGTNSVVNQASDTYLAYLWAEIAGFSKFSSYTGNGASDGPFVYCGFRPKFILIKDITTAPTNWQMIDTARDSVNIAGSFLRANTTAAENFSGFIDILSNGFKFRTTTTNTNTEVYVFAAFAENPFKYALAF